MGAERIMRVFHTEAQMMGNLKNGELIAVSLENFQLKDSTNDFSITISHSGKSRHEYKIDELLEKLGLDFQPEPKGSEES